VSRQDYTRLVAKRVAESYNYVITQGLHHFLSDTFRDSFLNVEFLREKEKVSSNPISRHSPLNSAVVSR